MTPEETDLRTRLLAEYEGWTYIHLCEEIDPDNRIVHGVRYDDVEWADYCKQECPLVGKPPDDDEADDSYHLPPYHTDLNALARVARKLGDDGYERDFDYALLDIWSEVRPIRRFTWQACLTAEELFIIYSDVVEQINKEKDND